MPIEGKTGVEPQSRYLSLIDLSFDPNPPNQSLLHNLQAVHQASHPIQGAPYPGRHHSIREAGRLKLAWHPGSGTAAGSTHWDTAQPVQLGKSSPLEHSVCR